MTRSAPTATTPFWLDIPYEPRPPLAGCAEADVCVVGGGIGGLSCARRLAELGLRVVLLEGRTVAGGASGRNGGFLLAGASLFHVDARERYGREDARRLYAHTLRAQEEVFALARELGAGDAVRRVGCLRVAASEEEAEHVVRHVEALREDGFPGKLLGGDDLPPAVRRLGRVACLTAHDGALQPARWIRTLARAAERAGVAIHEGSPVEGPVPAPGEGAVHSPGGVVRARHVVVAADGALPQLVPDYADRIRSRRLHMVATAPLPERLVDAVVYARWGFEYFQQLPDGRLACGGFGDLDGEDSYTSAEEGSPQIWARLERYVQEDLGLADAEVTHRWVGVVGYGHDGRPFVGPVPARDGLYVLGGYSGVGNLVGYVAGTAVAERIATGHSEDVRLFAADRVAE
ncbi:MAG TPA: FAD-dependent oxidoreductase [Solirubrobacteraceae bacterium]|nr:FAD-dependent oxidoreductase [Solirubrobacteraceae bacterium]